MYLRNKFPGGESRREAARVPEEPLEVMAEDVEVGESLSRKEVATWETLNKYPYNPDRNPEIYQKEVVSALIEAWKSAGDERPEMDMISQAVNTYLAWLSDGKMRVANHKVSPTANRDAFFKEFPLDGKMGSKNVSTDRSRARDRANDSMPGEDGKAAA